ncbi:asparagine synthase (glutamine-hydrolyzing) [Croceivirga thetidis]|uniref:asparagine synthase (glutamine-hydrolyzing) n=1 Tax=Croceivirga thetidis TaxID=2721623 RepID=A0ABX1GQ54_9FLAO|nr:asparagine synthase (glutamine-hydrolyzing) [Croceivirga thetidis]NKI32047.1 asparagine synthase (glutamine-hydrolyzing) [Croceivirga thetidis]
MCGIVGSINVNPVGNSLELIHHRGPDYQDSIIEKFAGNEVFLGHTRLSILDLSESGNQPMLSQCGNYAIIFNGEIYNHLELRKKLTSVSFKGTSDTETILYYIKEFGIDGVRDFNGIFALAFIDKKKDKFFLARDMFGVKPLYYYHKENKLIFGSEIKVIKDNPEYEKQVDLNALNTFLAFRYNPAPDTIFKDIKKLEAASYIVFDANMNVSHVDYWPRKQRINFSITEDEATEQYCFLFEQAIKRQALSDVPIGVLLSGGLDSAMVGSMMAKHSNQQIKTFTVGFRGKGNFNEMDDARITAEFINSDHYDVFMNIEQFLETFSMSYYHTEEPIATATIPPLYHVSKLANEHVKVVMSGQGADEPMAGYKRYRGEKIIADYGKFLSLLPLGQIKKMFPANPTLQRGIYSLGFKKETERFSAIFTLFTPEFKNSLLKSDYKQIIDGNLASSFSNLLELTDSKAHSLNRLLYLDTRSLLPDSLLLFNDKITMAHSIENRVPFLDNDLLEFVESLPVEFKLRGKKTKYIQKRAAAQFLPDHIINRKKRAFETPVGEWFKNELGDTLIELINQSNSFSSEFFNINFIEEMIQMHKAKKRDYEKHLFILLSLEYWYQNFFQPNFASHKQTVTN